uniref:Histone deacetylase n=1 Tax=Rhabditophanes sp. KR3021 TaxID=114890 RepID=A0AC35U0A7_9BILA
MASKSKITYYYHKDVGKFHYGCRHPMKPSRLELTHSLVLNYDLDKYMTMIEPSPCSSLEMEAFHSREYIDFLKNISPKNKEDLQEKTKGFCFIEDCPVFDGIFDFCALYSGGSVEGAQKLNRKESEIVINFPGGLHHAKKAEASGFCYVNDIVLAILELLKRHPRVLYIDIDIHHGDGVQEAFNLTDRVMTASFHKYGNGFFPCTGDMWDIGIDRGRYFSVNVPLREGIDDTTYHSLFKPVIRKIMERFDPSAVVLQCGSDSLGGDRLGQFNLSFDGHGECVKFVKSFGLPTMIVGGGGYTPKNVARAWANETAIIVEKDDSLPAEIPDGCEFKAMFGPDYLLKPKLDKRLENANTSEYLNALKELLFQNLDLLQGAPSVQMQPLLAHSFNVDKLKHKEELRLESIDNNARLRDRDPD